VGSRVELFCPFGRALEIMASMTVASEAVVDPWCAVSRGGEIISLLIHRGFA
jgi:hypothetical protein